MKTRDEIQERRTELIEHYHELVPFVGEGMYEIQQRLHAEIMLLDWVLDEERGDYITYFNEIARADHVGEWAEFHA